MPIRVLLGFLLTATATVAAADNTIKPASLRFASGNTDERPDFQRHVVPLLGRLGCNGRNCHGSFQGRGDFRLSLFGFDFQLDHRGMTSPATSGDALRTDPQHPDESWLIQKPTLDIEHEGGQRFERGSWEHHLLHQWIAGGARGSESAQLLTRLEVTPREIVVDQPDQPTQLTVTAVWDDGSREDVTPLCRFRTNDDSVAVVDRDGKVRSVGRGDTHVIAFYDNGVASVGVIRPFSTPRRDLQPRTNQQPRTEVDRWVLRKLDRLGIEPSDICDDATFLRRVSIDLTGTLPTPAEVTEFLNDESLEKRSRKIDELLERPAHAAWWANKFCDFTGCNPSQQAELGQETAVQWYGWIYARLRENVPYDELIERIVLARGRDDDQSYDEYARAFSAFYVEEGGKHFADRKGMPHFWSRRNLAKSEDKALAFAHSFLGLRLQCAQCHKHPFAPWSQQDFQEFVKFFDPVRFGIRPDAKERYRQLAQRVGLNLRGNQGSPIRPDMLKHARKGELLPWREVFIQPRESSLTLELLGDERVPLSADDDPREAIMSWMRRRENPWFATALVNRVWASYFHAGIIEPTDELNPANPPSHPELLQFLRDGFIDSGYDLRWLHRTIVSSDTYQRSWQPNRSNQLDRRNFSRAIPRRIPAEVVYDSVKQVVAATDQQTTVRTDLTRRAIGHLSMRLAGTYSMHVFGKPDRTVNCDCERVNRPTLLQSVFMQNDPLIDQRLADSGWLREIAEQRDHDVDSLVRSAWLRALAREPTDRQRQRALEHVRAAPSVAEGMRDLLWALLNTKEFILNH